MIAAFFSGNVELFRTLLNKNIDLRNPINFDLKTVIDRALGNACTPLASSRLTAPNAKQLPFDTLFSKPVTDKMIDQIIEQVQILKNGCGCIAGAARTKLLLCQCHRKAVVNYPQPQSKTRSIIYTI